MNDSRVACNGRSDIHANIGKGRMGLDGFRALMADEVFKGIPLILETPYPKGDNYPRKQEIEELYNLARHS